MPTSAAERRTPASGGRSGSATASGETLVVMLVSLARTTSFRRRWLRRISGLYRGAVHVESLDLQAGLRLGDGLLNCRLDHLLAQLILFIVELRRRRGAVLDDLDHVIAELRLY